MRVCACVGACEVQWGTNARDAPVFLHRKAINVINALARGAEEAANNTTQHNENEKGDTRLQCLIVLHSDNGTNRVPQMVAS